MVEFKVATWVVEELKGLALIRGPADKTLANFLTAFGGKTLDMTDLLSYCTCQHGLWCGVEPYSCLKSVFVRVFVFQTQSLAPAPEAHF